MEPSSEFPQQKGVTFFSPEETISSERNGFSSKEVDVSDIGKGRLVGAREVFQLSSGEEVILVTENGVEIINGEHIEEDREDVFEISLGFNTLREKQEFMVRTTLPDGRPISAHVGVSQDIGEIYSGTTNLWKIEGNEDSGKEYLLYVTADPKVLSRFGFTFERIINLPPPGTKLFGRKSTNDEGD